MLMVESYLTPYSYVRAYVTDEISKSNRKFLSQKQKFLGECRRTSTLVNDTNAHRNCLIKDLGENIRFQNQRGPRILSNPTPTLQNQKFRFWAKYLVNAKDRNSPPSHSTSNPRDLVQNLFRCNLYPSSPLVLYMEILQNTVDRGLSRESFK